MAATQRPRAQYILESYDDIITGLMAQMDQYAQARGGYINHMHPDQFNPDGTRKSLLSEETWKKLRQRKGMHAAVC
jgi:hypothetical protein